MYTFISVPFFAVMVLKQGLWSAKRRWLMASGVNCQMINVMTNHPRTCHAMKSLVTNGEWNTPALPVEVPTRLNLIKGMVEKPGTHRRNKETG